MPGSTSRPTLASWTGHPRHGPLPAILLLLTLGTGLVDAISILRLGRVFVANMTGNVVFIGFALAGAPGFSLLGSVVALVTFLLGAAVGGFLIGRFAGHRGRLLRNALLAQLLLFLVALGITPDLADLAVQLAVLGVAAFPLGVQNSVVRHLAVPDMTTTVLTMTLTGIGADLRRGDLATAARRVVAVVSMLVGALVGALLVLGEGVPAALVAVVAVTAAALVAAAAASRGEPDWAVPRA
ncbi:YoaK family protein [Microlunatus flavus]|uniref:Uncharacterized membrane protein YoaK, UPF0700 family n=1 Tax=Microlunatus flavus TaxID=1036181 RepID=A0A1H8ZG17_9ACTN|nr:YoaK family protein [Microlunatus flavus]SEP63370.1 Uncharacterized membrane protein YoaK, UPF0700 family [Microlunatus flavus]